MAEKPQGAGSIWNPNSWHWEMKNYTEVAKEIVRDKVLLMEIRHEDYVLRHTKVKFNKAQAEVNIRKGKQYLVYEFELSVTFSAESEGDEIEGTYEIKEISCDDLNDIVVEGVKSECKNKFVERVKVFICKTLKQNYVDLFKHFAEDLQKIEGDPEKLEADKRKREVAMVEMNKAREDKGLEKERLLEEQRQKEKQMKVEFAKKASEKEA